MITATGSPLATSRAHPPGRPPGRLRPLQPMVSRLLHLMIIDAGRNFLPCALAGPTTILLREMKTTCVTKRYACGQMAPDGRFNIHPEAVDPTSHILRRVHFGFRDQGHQVHAVNHGWHGSGPPAHQRWLAHASPLHREVVAFTCVLREQTTQPVVHPGHDRRSHPCAPWLAIGTSRGPPPDFCRPRPFQGATPPAGGAVPLSVATATATWVGCLSARLCACRHAGSGVLQNAIQVFLQTGIVRRFGFGTGVPQVQHGPILAQPCCGVLLGPAVLEP